VKMKEVGIGNINNADIMVEVVGIDNINNADIMVEVGILQIA